MNRMRMARLAGTAVLAAALAAAVVPSAAATPASTTAMPSALLTAMQRDLGLTADQVYARVAQEERASAADSQLAGRLGDAFAGSWFDSRIGTLVVAVTDAARVPQIQAAGATARLVQHNAAQLDALKASLDQRRASAPNSVTGWGVDQTTNSVVVSVLNSDPAGMAWAASLGARSEPVAAAPKPLWSLIGGQAIRNSQARCSIAFSARSGSTRYILTAGHCGELGGTWSGSGGTIGPVFRFNFPTDDFAAIRVDSAAAVQTALVDRFSAGSDVTVAGSTQQNPGTSICRSGSTTGWHCGTITRHNQTVDYGNGDVVFGLTQTNVCAEPGDSGGAYVSPNGATRVQAQGITSGGSGNCSSGGTTFHQPVNEALSRYGLSLVTG
jgi:streptogrisin C